MISADNLTKAFGHNIAVDQLSFNIKSGEIIGLLGPNGAGKTTTMRMLTGFLTPDSGRIEINGLSVLDEPTEVQKMIGYLPENNPLYTDMLVSDLLQYSADLKGLDRVSAGKGIDFAVNSVSIEDVYHRQISELSKGYRQRVGIALALLHQPQILILDEPSEGLDPNQRNEIRLLIRNLAKNHTVVVSTHVMQEVEAVCTRMIIINKGRLVADGTPKDLTAKTMGNAEMLVEIEGRNIEKTLEKMKEVKKVTVQTQKSNRFLLKLQLAKGYQIQPQLAQAAARNKWIIWKLTETEHHLEDVFYQLTKE